MTVCTYGGFAPVCYKNPAGQLIGLDVSFLTRFADSPGLPIVTIEQPFDGIWTHPGEDVRKPGAVVCDIAGAGVMQRADRPVGPGGSWSEPYFQVDRSLLVRAADQAAFDHYERLDKKKIVVTEGSTAEIDARERTLSALRDPVHQGRRRGSTGTSQAYIVTTLIAEHRADAFGEGDVSNKYLRDKYGKDVAGGLALADRSPDRRHG